MAHNNNVNDDEYGRIIFDQYNGENGKRYTIEKETPESPVSINIWFANGDMFGIHIPNLRISDFGARWARYTAGLYEDITIQTQYTIDEDGHIENRSIYIRTPNFTLYRMADDTMVEEMELLERITYGLHDEEYRQETVRSQARNLSAFRQTMGNQRPTNNRTTGYWYEGPPNHIPALLAVPAGPGATIASFLSGARGSPAQQASTLRGSILQRNARKTRKNRK